jgi:hypothetical protein
MRVRMIMMLVLVTGMAGVCCAQSREPSTGSESSSTGQWPSVDSGHSDSVGYGSGDHGNVS